MTTAEKEFLSNAVVEALRNIERGYASGRMHREATRCVFCGKSITTDGFYIIREGDGYAAGCIHCGALRETYPSVNPFMFSNLARSRTN